MEVWKKARELSKAVYAATSRREFAHDSALRDQIRRAAVSIVSNIAEGFERGSDKELKQFLIIGKGSAGEERLGHNYMSRWMLRTCLSKNSSSYASVQPN